MTSSAAIAETRPLPPAAPDRGASPLVDLSDPVVRGQLTPAALEAFFNLMRLWRVRDTDAMVLLGGVSNGRYYVLKKGDANTTLSQDMLQRISLLVGIFDGLHGLFGEELANAWIQVPNTNRLFGGAPPLALLLKDGIPAMLMLRRLVEARNVGP